MPTAEAQAFAERMGSTFIETSAKTSVGVKDVFEVRSLTLACILKLKADSLLPQAAVQRILDTPELWDPSHKPSVQRTDGGRGGLPGGMQVVNLGGSEEEAQQGSCAC